jgi:hypothetical protein
VKALAASAAVLRSPWVFFVPWAAWLFYEVFRHLVQFSSGPHLAAMDSRNGALETALFYGLSMLLVVRVIQQNDFASWAKVALSLAIFLEATTLPLTVDFLFLHAGAGPVFWTVLAQVIPVALPFLFFLWLASVTRNMIWFLAGVALAFPVVYLLYTPADQKKD